MTVTEIYIQSNDSFELLSHKIPKFCQLGIR